MRERGYWKNIENRKAFLDKLAVQFNIKEPKEWGLITAKNLAQNGGGSLLKFFDYSVAKVLKETYTDINWQRSWFVNISPHPKYYWNKQTTRSFMENLGKKYGVTKPSDWGNITNEQLLENGGHRLLTNHYSIRKILLFAFPDIEWKSSWFTRRPTNFWLSKANQKQFLEDFAKLKGFKKPCDWGKVTIREIHEAKGARTLLQKYNTNSAFKLLNSVFPEIEWKREWFHRISKYSKSYWDSFDNTRGFLDSFAAHYNLNRPEDWQRISLSMIRSKGGAPLLAKYNGSLYRILQDVYPFFRISNFRSALNSPSSPQKDLTYCLTHLFPKFDIISNFQHPDIRMELDVWIPKLNLAFEFQGEHHYLQTYTHDLGVQRQRDAKRKALCRSAGITLIEIPFWWNRKRESLAATVLQNRPDLHKQLLMQ